MSKRQPYEHGAVPRVASEGGAEPQELPLYWRSLEERAQLEDPEFRATGMLAARAEEFTRDQARSPLADENVDEAGRRAPKDGAVTRRGFMNLLGASMALMGATGCRRPVEKILPYTRMPEEVIPGVASRYATVLARRGEALGLLVECHDGRPTKVEGNPSHPASLGSSDILSQAAILGLYDPDRSGTPAKAGGKGASEAGAKAAFTDETWAAFDKEMANRLSALEGKGSRVRILMEPTLSPTMVRVRAGIAHRFPGSKVHFWSAVNETAQADGTRLAMGAPHRLQYAFDKARVVLSLDADFLQTETGMVKNTRLFAQGRKLRAASDVMNRLYVAEGILSTTGSAADERLRIAPSQVTALAAALIVELATKHNVPLAEVAEAAKGVKASPLSDKAKAWVVAVAADLAKHQGAGIVLAGSTQPPIVHALAASINRGLGNLDRTVIAKPWHDPLEAEVPATLPELTAAMKAGEVEALFIVAGNPVFDAPADLGFRDALAKVPFSVHLSEHRDETSAHATWHIPLSHPFEAWGDATSIDGSIAVQQPLIAPLRDTRSAIEVLAAVAGAMGAKGYDLVRHTLLPGLGSEAAWQRGLQSGVMVPFVEGPASAIPIVDHAKVAASLAAYQIPPAPTKDAVEVVFRPCPKLLDGRFANNPWLQELPDPATKIVWDNAALLSKKTADALGVKGGELLTVSAESGAVTLPAWVLPGHADDVISVYMGWGRTHAGRVGSGRVGMGRDVATPLARFGKTPMGASDRTSGGFDVFPLRTTKGLFFVSGAKVARQGGKYELVQTQDHDSMEGRPLALEATYAEYKKKPRFAEIGSPPPSRTLPIWQKVDYSKGHRWGMTIDLNACTGCTACVVACQAENNILIVGKEQVARGRELHWLRIDRYFLGDAEDPKVAHQPVACVHCEEAPCENVCPVNATVHSPEGLNDMAYNRCIGTRYCANNCPYKVRRFNYLDYKSEFWHPEDKEISPIAEVPATVKMQFNPDVTVRMRGVMEKCTYCVQRIQQAKIETKRQGHKIKDGDVVTACQQACPAQAIVFGDLNDTSSEVAKLTNLDRRYRLLAELGTAPRTTYLAKVRNPNEANAPKTAAAERKESAG